MFKFFLFLIWVRGSTRKSRTWSIYSRHRVLHSHSHFWLFVLISLVSARRSQTMIEIDQGDGMGWDGMVYKREKKRLNGDWLNSGRDCVCMKQRKRLGIFWAVVRHYILRPGAEQSPVGRKPKEKVETEGSTATQKKKEPKNILACNTALTLHPQCFEVCRAGDYSGTPLSDPEEGGV